MIRERKVAIVMPDILRTQNDCQMFAVDKNISLVRINIQELIDKIGKRGCLLLGDAKSANKMWTPLDSSISEGYRRELSALMTLSLIFNENTEFAIIFIICIWKYLPVTIRTITKFI